MRLATAFVEVRPDMTKFGPELQKGATDSAGDVAKKLGQVLAGGAFIAGANRAKEAASQLQQAVGGTEAVFGSSADAVEDWAQRAAESAGLSERAARELTSQIGGLLKGFGFTSSEAADLSTQLAQLGADLAATFGGNPEDAVIALGAALRGETDPLERFGIALNQTLVNQKAVELGLAATTSAVDQHAKAQATLALITERSADAQGQFAREADTAAGQAAISAAKAENAAADLGENLLPIYTKLSEVVGMAADAFGALPEPVQTALIVLGGIVALSGPVKLTAEAISSMATIARTTLTKGLDAAATGAYSFAGNLGKVAAGAGALGAAFVGASLILDQYQKDKAEAARIEEEYTRLLSEQSDAVGENTRAFTGAELLKGGLGDALRDANVNVSALTLGISENADAVSKLNNEAIHPLHGTITNLSDALADAGLEGTALADELLRLEAGGKLSEGQLKDLIERLSEQADGYKVGAREAKNKATADEEAGIKAEEAAPKVAGLTEELSLHDQAAKDAAESMDLFREAVERALQPLDYEEAVDAQAQALADLAADVEGRAQAVDDARQRLADLKAAPAEDRDPAAIADAQRDLDEAIAASSLTLEGNTEAALRNRDALRDVTQRSVDVIESAREQGRSLSDLQTIRAMEIQSMRDQLTQMGFNEEEIERYIDVIEDIPLTKGTTLTLETATAEAKLKAALDRMNRQIELNPYSSDATQAEKFVIRAIREAAGFAAGGDVMDGLFRVHEGELMRKQGASVEVIAGAPTPVTFDAVGEDLLLVMKEQNDLLRRALFGGGSIDGQRAAALELT